MHEPENIVELKDGPGRRLRATRQARGLEIDSVAAELHLKPSVVNALEHDRYDDLPGPVFVVGYMRNYARLLGMDPDPLLDAYRAANRLAEPPRPRSALAAKEQVGSGHLAVRLVSLAIVAVLTGLAIVWWQNQSPSMETAADPAEPAVSEELETAIPDEPAAKPVEPPQPPSVPQAAELEPAPETVPVAAAPQGPETPSEDVEGNNAPEEAVEAGAEEQASQEQPEPAETEVAAADSPATNEVVLDFRGPCWVDIRDSERKFKLFGEMRKGDRHVLEGKPPYSLIIGNASAVEITVGDKRIDLNAIARGNVARFTLDPEQLP